MARAGAGGTFEDAVDVGAGAITGVVVATSPTVMVRTGARTLTVVVRAADGRAVSRAAMAAVTAAGGDGGAATRKVADAGTGRCTTFVVGAATVGAVMAGSERASTDGTAGAATLTAGAAANVAVVSTAAGTEGGGAINGCATADSGTRGGSGGPATGCAGANVTNDGAADAISVTRTGADGTVGAGGAAAGELLPVTRGVAGDGVAGDGAGCGGAVATTSAAARAVLSDTRLAIISRAARAASRIAGTTGRSAGAKNVVDTTSGPNSPIFTTRVGGSVRGREMRTKSPNASWSRVEVVSGRSRRVTACCRLSAISGSASAAHRSASSAVSVTGCAKAFRNPDEAYTSTVPSSVARSHT